MVSEQALARKQRFMDLKKEHGGDVNGVTKHYESLDWNVWFEEDGTIVSMSKEPNNGLSEKYESAKFSNDQVAILKDKNWNLYRIVTDKVNKHVKYIQVRPVEIDRVSTDDFFLYQVDKHSKRVYDIKLSLGKSTLTITAHANLLKQYEDVNISDAIIKGRKILPFYITTKNDPSFMLRTVNISLEDLLQNKKIVLNMPEDFRGSSVFTLKLFDNYNFIEEKK